MMDATPPAIAEALHVHGMQSRDLPGFYNSSCSPLTSTTCISQLHLVCLEERCVCVEKYISDGSGGCKADMITLLAMWVIRLFVCVSIFMICLAVCQMLVSSRSCRGRRDRRQDREREAEEGRRGSSSTLWYDEPPSYLEVAEEEPPPSYLEAVAKERMRNGDALALGDATNEATERTEPPQPTLHRREADRGVEALTIRPQPHPAPLGTAAPHTLHM